MSGMYCGLQKRIQNIQPKAPYVHCLAHNLNLVLEDSVKSTVQMQTFYEILQKAYVFFSVSIIMSADAVKYPVLKSYAEKDGHLDTIPSTLVVQVSEKS